LLANKFASTNKPYRNTPQMKKKTRN